MFKLNIYNALLNRPSLRIWKCPQNKLFSKSCPHRTLPQQILHDLSPNSSMLCFDMFGLNLHSALLQDFHSVIGNAPKEFVSQKLSTQSTARENTAQGDTKFHYVVLLYICSNWKSIPLFSKTFTPCLKMPHRNFIKAFQMYTRQLATAWMKSKTLS